MRDRRLWVVAAVIVVAVLGMVLLRACTSSSSAGAASPTPSLSSPSPVTTPTPSASVGVSTEPSGSAVTSPVPTTSASPSTAPIPVPSGSIAADGLPVVTISRPQRGDAVRLPLQLAGTAVAFEAVLRYEILDSRGRVIANGPAYADAGAPQRGHWQVEVELPLGRYTAVAFVESPKDGSRIAEARVKFHAG